MNVSSISSQATAALVEPAAPRPLREDQQNLIHAVRAVNAAEYVLRIAEEFKRS